MLFILLGAIDWIIIAIFFVIILIIGLGVSKKAGRSFLDFFLSGRKTDDETLRRFYQLVRPGGIGWNKLLVRLEKNGNPVAEKATQGDLPLGILCMIAGVFAVYGTVFASGYYLYGKWIPAIIATLIAGLSMVFLIKKWGNLEME